VSIGLIEGIVEYPHS